MRLSRAMFINGAIIVGTGTRTCGCPECGSRRHARMRDGWIIVGSIEATTTYLSKVTGGRPRVNIR